MNGDYDLELVNSLLYHERKTLKKICGELYPGKSNKALETFINYHRKKGNIVKTHLNIPQYHWVKQEGRKPDNGRKRRK